jgi:hypothetical protein
MEINFEKPTPEQVEAIRKALPNLNLGMVIDPTKPLTREQAEALKVQVKVAGEEKEVAIWDTMQGFTKQEGADIKLRAASKAQKDADAKEVELEKAVKFYKAGQALIEAEKSGQAPTREVIRAVAEGMTTEVDDLVAALEGAGTEEKATAKAAAGGGRPNRKITLEDLDPALAARLKTQAESDFIQEQLHKSGNEYLAAAIKKALDKDPRIVKVMKDIGNDANKKAIFDKLEKIATGTVDTRSRGRIQQLTQAGAEIDLDREIDGVVRDVVETLDIPSILAKAAPAPILLGSGELGVGPMAVLSNEKVKRVTADHPDYLDNQVKEVMQQMAEQGVGVKA